MKVGSSKQPSELALRIFQIHLCIGDFIHEPSQMSFQLDSRHLLRDPSETKDPNAEAFVGLKITWKVRCLNCVIDFIQGGSRGSNYLADFVHESAPIPA